MTEQELDGFARSRGFGRLDKAIFGIYGGYPFWSSWQVKGRPSFLVTFQVTGKGSSRFIREVRKTLPKGCSFFKQTEDRYALSGSCREADGDIGARFCETMDLAAAAMREEGLVPEETCPICRGGECDATALLSGGYVHTHRSCVEQLESSAVAEAERSLQGNYFTGFLGALIGGLIGAIPAILCMNFLERYVAMLFVLVPLGAYYGYRLCKGKMNGGALACTILSSLVNLFSVEFLSVYIQLGLARSSFPTPGFAWRVFLEYVGEDGFVGSIAMSAIFMALGLWIAWGQIRRGAKDDIRDAQTVAATLLPQ